MSLPFSTSVANTCSKPSPPNSAHSSHVHPVDVKRHANDSTLLQLVLPTVQGHRVSVRKDGVVRDQVRLYEAVAFGAAAPG